MLNLRDNERLLLLNRYKLKGVLKWNEAEELEELLRKEIRSDLNEEMGGSIYADDAQ